MAISMIEQGIGDFGREDGFRPTRRPSRAARQRPPMHRTGAWLAALPLAYWAVAAATIGERIASEGTAGAAPGLIGPGLATIHPEVAGALSVAILFVAWTAAGVLALALGRIALGAPAGRVTPMVALGFGLVAAVLGVALLAAAIGGDTLTAAFVAARFGALMLACGLFRLACRYS